MDSLAGAASVIAVIDLSAKIIALCSQYIAAVKHARKDIECIKKKVGDIRHIMEGIKKLLDGPHKAQLSTTHGLFKSLEQCLEQLQQLKDQLMPGKTRKAMSRFGVRALKWPFTSKQVKDTLSSLEVCKRSFTLALQVDQTNLIIDIGQKLDLATQDTRTIHRKLDSTALPVAMGASFNSHTEEHNARCLNDTRTKLLNKIETWANNKEGKSIFWLSGMAGTGKSTIARTIAQSFADCGQLGASFFFKKGEGERGNASRFFTTIAVELMAHEPDMIPSIRTELDKDPAISQRALEDQFEKLISKPLSRIQQAASQAPARIVVIDALDECEQEQDIRVILQLLARTKDIRPMPLRIFVTSRPELHIRLGFKEMPNGTYQDLILHKVPRRTIEHDIRLFLKHELGVIQKDRMLSSDWPATHQIQALVELAVPLFIYAATVCRYVGTKGSNPMVCLNRVLQYQKATFSQLDRIYLPILDQLLEEQEDDDKEMWLQEFRKVVGSVVVLERPLSIASLAYLLQVPKEDIKCRFDFLHSVLSVPDNEEVPVRLFHLSFREFLVDRHKQGKSLFWVDERGTHMMLTSCCLERMSGQSGLHQNMCNLSAPGILRDEIDEGMVAAHLSPDLQYACRYWITHLKYGKQNIIDGDTTQLFLQNYLLHWIEAMSLMRELGRCVQLLDDLQTLVDPSARSMLDFLRDARQFVLRFQYVLTYAPLQIYCSALVFAPETSLVRRTFANQVQQEVDMLSMREAGWDAWRNTLEGHSDWVTAVTFSPDGQLVASASYDSTVRVWDAATGMCHSTLKGHSNRITTVAFSLDGQLVASASDDSTVRVWEATKGTCRSTLKGHSSKVTAVVFSPNGQLVASASDNSTVRVWEVATGTCRSTLEGHSDWVTAVNFSSDGQLVASAPRDNTVRVWELAGTCLSTLEGHSDWVTAVTFSPDGRLVASASWDGTVRVWEAAGTYRSTLEGYSSKVTAVTFLPDRQLVASASNDRTAQVWEATGTHSSTLDIHSALVTTMAFSSNGQILHTNVDDFPVSFPSTVPLPSWQQKQSFNIIVQGQWILRNQQRVLWLPSEYRTYSVAVHKDLVCLGLVSGHLVLLRIH